MNEFWSQFQGRTVDHSYLLGELLGAKQDDAVYLTESREGLPAVIKVRRAEPADSGRQREIWLAAAELNHPNLIRVFGAGASELDNHPIDYIVMERAEITLASVLSERALSDAEVREMLPPALAAVGFLHQGGFLHSSIRPSNVMAVGDTLKLSVDDAVRAGDATPNRPLTAYDAPETQTGVFSNAGDSWSLGALVLHALTLQLPEVRGNSVVLPELERPFSDIVSHTLVVDAGKRWKIRQVAEALEGRPVSVPVPPPEPTRVEPAVKPSPAYEGYKPRALAERPTPPDQTVSREPSASWRVPAIVLAALLLLIVFWLARRNSSPAAATPVASVPQTSVPQTSAPAVPPIAAGDTRPSPLAARTKKPVPPPAASLNKRGTGSWYVVVATYVGKTDAEKRARAITARWPKFPAHVFDPPVRDPHHLVVIASNVSEEEADAIKTRARAAGLAPDVYIKKFGR